MKKNLNQKFRFNCCIYFLSTHLMLPNISESFGHCNLLQGEQRMINPQINLARCCLPIALNGSSLHLITSSEKVCHSSLLSTLRATSVYQDSGLTKAAWTRKHHDLMFGTRLRRGAALQGGGRSLPRLPSSIYRKS